MFCLLSVFIIGGWNISLLMKRENPTTSSELELAHIIERATEPSTRLVIVDRGDPTIFYLSKRKGWHAFPNQLNDSLENNVVLYKIEMGKRTDLPLKGLGKTYGKKIFVPSGKWSTLKIVARDSLFKVYNNEAELFEVEDQTFPQAGKAGLWTKADSYTAFDNLVIVQLDK